MADAPRSWWRRIVSAVKVLFWLFADLALFSVLLNGEQVHHFQTQ